MSVRLIDAEAYRRALSIRDLTDAVLGPHAMQLLVHDAVAALRERCRCAGVNTRTHHLQVADDVLLLANGANIVAMQSYDNLRGYFENTLVGSITNQKKFRSGLSIHDISRPGEMREIAFL